MNKVEGVVGVSVDEGVSKVEGVSEDEGVDR